MQNAKPEMEQLTAWYNEKKEVRLNHALDSPCQLTCIDHSTFASVCMLIGVLVGFMSQEIEPLPITKVSTTSAMQMGLATQYQPEMTQRMADVWRKYDCHPLKSLLPPIAQAPVFIGFFGALRSMAEAKVRHCPTQNLICFAEQSMSCSCPLKSWCTACCSNLPKNSFLAATKRADFVGVIVQTTRGVWLF